ncbi:sensor histidine kinase [Streptomyces sp. NPDC057696]|uniref:sensor histidine kinase n=1 Tax=Streptomyces sp. NPDC057696 TaxID=3346218 RepID=UPI0036C530E8
MVSVQSPPGGREIPYTRVLLLPAVAMAAATGAAVAVVAQPARLAVALCGGLATLLLILVAAEAVRRGRTIKWERAQSARHVAHLERSLAARDDEAQWMARYLLPESLYRLRSGDTASEAVKVVVESDPSHSQLPAAQRRLMAEVLDLIDREENMRDAAQRAFVSIARRVQSIVHKQNAELREMEEDHGRNPEVFDDLLRIDHGTALIGRLADSITVLGGARPGRQWPRPVPLYSVLRGAMSRILEYPRIELHSIAKVAIRGISVEPLIHALAELMDNATRYSPPQTKVHVTAVEVQTGIAIEIEDGGVSLSEEARGRAEEMLARAKAGIDLNDLGENPRLGMAVVGRLSQMYDMQIALRQSAYGGVRAVLIVPRIMITTDAAPGLAHGIGASGVPRVNNDGEPIVEEPRKKKLRRPTTGPRPSAPLMAAMEDDVPVVTEWRANGLPQRRRKVDTKVIDQQIIVTPRAPENGGGAAPRADQPPQWTPIPVPASEAEPEKPDQPEPGLWVEAFMNGLKGDGQGDASGEPTGTNQQVDEGDRQ